MVKGIRVTGVALMLAAAIAAGACGKSEAQKQAEEAAGMQGEHAAHQLRARRLVRIALVLQHRADPINILGREMFSLALVKELQNSQPRQRWP